MQHHGIYTDEDLARYAAQWDADSAADEIVLDRYAATYDADPLVSADDPPPRASRS